MVEIKFELESSLSKEDFFGIRSDPEHTQKLVPEILTFFKLISADGENKTYEEHSTFNGFTTKSTVKHILDFPNSQEIQIIDGDIKDTVFKEIFESLPNGGSKLTVKVDMKLSGPFWMMGFFAINMIKNSIKEFYIVLEESQRKYLKLN